MSSRRIFGQLADGTSVDALTLGRAGGLRIVVLTYGCVITTLEVPDASGVCSNVVLGFDRLAGYVEQSPYFGAIIGRYANRIANARFVIDGREHHLSANEPPHHLHGGFRGFDKRVWQAEASDEGRAIALRLRSEDGDEGYPGTVDAQVTYTLGDNELRIDYEAVADAPTHVNLTQHSYFNLHGSGDVLSQSLAINATTYLPVDERMIPTGEFAAVANTPFDFQELTPIGARLRADHEQLKRAGGYDHNFNINLAGEGPTQAARVVEPSSGRTVEVHSTEPGLQFYSGQVVDYRGFCLEPQHYPDSPNRPQFPPTLLRPGERYRSTTIFVFGIS